MNIFPAVDIYDGKVVRLYKGNYDEMTVYGDSPLAVAREFEAKGAKFIHMVDLEGAKTGGVPNLDAVSAVAKQTSLFVEIGGGIRSMEVVDSYMDAGVGRVIIGTAAVKNEPFLIEALEKYGERIAVGADVKDGRIAIKGWLETSDYTLDAFLMRMVELGVKTVICTDISKDGAMAGTNLEMYRALSKKYAIDIVASGGVSSISDIEALRRMDLYGAIIGKAYYTGAIKLEEALEVAK
jgi:phosphoribosylformimino-5-aminoimidazole carboxamide ribotide isomerase